MILKYDNKVSIFSSDFFSCFDLLLLEGMVDRLVFVDFSVMIQFLWGLGLPEEEAEFCDVYGFDDELLEMVPKPVLAVLFLFPITAEVRIFNLFV